MNVEYRLDIAKSNTSLNLNITKWNWSAMVARNLLSFFKFCTHLIPFLITPTITHL